MAKPVILCVDDEKIVLDSLKGQLNDIFIKEFDIEFAESGDEAIEIIEELLEDDKALPRKGFTVLKKIKKSYRKYIYPHKE